MLFAVEGGGFFSASASGYSNGLTLLLLGQRNEERSMRVSPCNQYQLVEKEFSPIIQLAPKTNHKSRGCAFLTCFRRPSAGLDETLPPKVGPVHQSDSLPDTSFISNEGRDSTASDAGDENEKRIFLKSSLKKPLVVVGQGGANGTQDEAESSITGYSSTRKVQWTDTCGKELVEIREFEPSDEAASDEEFEHTGNIRCGCAIQ